MTSSPIAADALGARPASSFAPNRLAPRLAAALLAATAAASLAYWALQITSARSADATRGNSSVAARLPEAAEPERVAQLLGAAVANQDTGPTGPVAARLQLVGVAAGISGRGSALISVDGRPARPFAVGVAVGEGLVLQSVQGRRAQLGPSLQAPASLVLELPPLPR